MKALITGASSGIGRDIAIYLSKKGYDLVIVARRVELLEELKKELKTNVEIVNLDISSVENCKKLFEEYKDVDVLVNNAGFGLFGHFSELDLEKELSMINTNIIAVHILTKLYLQEMKKKNSGHILNVASIAGFMVGPLMATYYATKNYVVSLSRAINKELKKEKSKVRICTLCPGPVKTNFNNVAGVKFGINSLSSEYVAKYAVDNMLKNREIIVPGFTIKILRFLNKILPSSIMIEGTFHTQKHKNR